MINLLVKYRAWKKKFEIPSWATVALSGFVFLALFGDFLANEKPLY